MMNLIFGDHEFNCIMQSHMNGVYPVAKCCMRIAKAEESLFFKLFKARYFSYGGVYDCNNAEIIKEYPYQFVIALGSDGLALDKVRSLI
ncbi:hypothetical protein Lal_00047584 [Lupinus albus]|nr:hypothetical protein Lal_00047584 [Lupinus albus]